MYSATVETGQEAALRFYNDHVNEVKAHVPPAADRLLVWRQVKEGWTPPLCKFLDVPIPDEPFTPHRKN